MKCFCRAHPSLLAHSAFGGAPDVFSNPGEQRELSLLRGSLIGFLHLCKLGYHPLGRFPAYCTRVKPSLWWASVTPFSREWVQLTGHTFIYPQGATQTSKGTWRDCWSCHLAPLLIPASSQGHSVELPGLEAHMNNGLTDGEIPAFQLHGSFQDGSS